MRQIAPLPLRLRCPNAVRVLTVLFVVAARRPARGAPVRRRPDRRRRQQDGLHRGGERLQPARRDHRGQRPRRRRRHQPRGHDLHVDASRDAGEDAAATGDLDIKDDLTLTGVSRASTIIDAQGLGDRVIQTDPTGHDTITVTIQHLTVENGSSPQIAFVNAEGGGIRNGRTAPGGVDRRYAPPHRRGRGPQRVRKKRRRRQQRRSDDDRRQRDQQQHDQRPGTMRGGDRPGRRRLAHRSAAPRSTATTPTAGGGGGGGILSGSSAPATRPS